MTAVRILLILCAAAPALAGPASSKDAPEISRSVGVDGGAVIMWPRIIPKSELANTRALASSLRDHLRKMVEKQLPGRPIDMRPEPERVCPRQGCKAVSLGALIIREKEGCLVVALVGRPGQYPLRLVPWVGKMRLKEEWVTFREPPESRVQIIDYAKCSQVISGLAERERYVLEAIRTAATPAAEGK
jgi:hypothetical protein